ncbi:MAG: amidohydrolase family protein [Spirochaetota bacterium]
MGALFEVKDIDRRVYEEELKLFLPGKIIDIHTHVWIDSLKKHTDKEFNRVVKWPALVAKDNSVEDLTDTYRLMFPGKSVTPLMFSLVTREEDFDSLNNYVRDSAARYRYPALLFTPPWWRGEEMEQRIIQGGFKGIKVYLNLAPEYIPVGEIRIFDFLPHHQLEVINRHRWIVMLHIPRNDRLNDPVNLAQMLEIERKYPDVRLIIAHVGRAYCPEDVGHAFEVLSETQQMMFDFAANTNDYVFTKLIQAVGPKRILFGSDLPILRMRMRRVCEGGNYVNLVPRGLYGDVSGDKNMRAVEGEEAEKLTFFMYEELLAFKKAAVATGLTKKDIEDIFYNNACSLIYN